MENVKKTTILLLCVVLITYPVISTGQYCYASEPEWSPVTTEKQKAAAIKAWLQTYNTKFIFSGAFYAGNNLPSKVAGSTNQIIHQISNSLGLDMNQLQNNIKYRIASNGALQFMYDSSIASALNNIYAQLIGKYNVAPNETKRIYSGEIFTDPDGYQCQVFILKGSAFTNGSASDISYWGTPYKYEPGSFSTIANSEDHYCYFNLGSSSIKKNIKKSYVTSPFSWDYVYCLNMTNNSYDAALQGTGPHTEGAGLDPEIEGYFCIFKRTVDNDNFPYGFGVYSSHLSVNDARNRIYTVFGSQITQSAELEYVRNNALSAAQDIARQGAKDGMHFIGQQAVIQVGKDGLYNPNVIDNYLTDDNPDEPQVDNDVNDDEPVFPEPTPNPNTPNTGVNINPNGDINFHMPDLNVDWNLDFGQNIPFPFSIPFDIINFFNAFVTEPVTPHIEENITISNMTIPIDIDLSWLDDVAGYFRTFILLSYIFGLIIATRAIFHIY